MKKWSKKVWAIIKAQFIKLDGRWEDDLIWCPSQCYYIFDRGGVHWCVYIRWRGGDPWTADLIENFCVLNNPGEKWIELPIGYHKDMEIVEAKEDAIEAAKLYFAGFFDGEMEATAIGQRVKQEPKKQA